MESTTFDRLTQMVARRLTRRAAVPLLSVGALTRMPNDDVFAKRKGKGKGNGKKKGCGKGQRKCGKACIAADACCSDADCPVCEAKFCVDGTCGCVGSLIEHRGVCGKFVQCKSTGEISTETYSSDCCSNRGAPDGQGNSICQPGTGGCLADKDCESGPCRGFMCPELYNIVTRC